MRAVSGSRSRNRATEGNVASPPLVRRTRGRGTCTRRPPNVSSVCQRSPNNPHLWSLNVPHPS
jgi:hypothetical protein